MFDRFFRVLSAFRGSRWSVPVRRASFVVRMWSSSHAAGRPVARLYAGWGQYKRRNDRLYSPEDRVVTETTEVVIDGFMGSANTFATAAFRSAQRRDVRIAHHMHSAVDVRRAVRLGVPVVVTVREPGPTALSVVSRWTFLDVEQVLRAYCWYYESLLPVRHRVVVSRFEETTGDLGAVIERLNRSHGTVFEPFEHTRENVDRLRGSSQERASRDESRRKIKDRARGALETPAALRLLDRATTVYRRFIESHPLDPTP